MTQRPLFDPSKMKAARPGTPPDAPPPASPGPSPETPLTVSQLAERIDRSLRDGIPGSIRVIGEVSGFRERTHWYFDLKDAASVVNCAVFASAARRVGFTPENGQQVVAKGRVEFYAKGGKVTLLVDALEPVGAGALELAFRRLCEELRSLGYFAPERKRPVPRFPRKVAVVTSRTGAALQDVLDTMRRRCPAVEVLVVDVRVQGEGAAAEVADAVTRVGANAAALGVDAILVTRGGGSMEDLWAFNERVVADAIFACPIPVVAAIGHETDVTVAELVADERAATPTQAAMRLTPDTPALLRQLDALSKRLASNVERRWLHARDRVRDLSRHTLLANPAALVTTARARADAFADLLERAIGSRLRDSSHAIARLASRLDASRPSALHARTLARVGMLHDRLHRAGDLALARRRDRLDALERQLRAVSPLAVLDRGYSVTTGPDGRVLRSTADVRTGEVISTRLPDGTLRSIVDERGSSHPSPPPKPRPASRPTGKRSSPEQGPGLFT